MAATRLASRSQSRTSNSNASPVMPGFSHPVCQRACAPGRAAHPVATSINAAKPPVRIETVFMENLQLRDVTTTPRSTSPDGSWSGTAPAACWRGRESSRVVDRWRAGYRRPVREMACVSDARRGPRRQGATRLRSGLKTDLVDADAAAHRRVVPRRRSLPHVDGAPQLAARRGLEVHDVGMPARPVKDRLDSARGLEHVMLIASPQEIDVDHPPRAIH